MKPDHPDRHYEYKDVNAKAIGLLGVALTILLIGTALITYGVMRYFQYREEQKHEAVPPLFQERVIPPSPRLQVHPAEDYEKFKKAQQEIMETYGWVDRKRGIVRIPVERAMELIEKRGVPERKGTGLSPERGPA